MHNTIRLKIILLIKTISMNINQIIPTDFQINITSGNEKNSSLSKNQKLSFDSIRIFRQHFEQGTNPLRSILGEDKHQTMIVAMFEGTEKLLNKNVSEFAVLEYLEGLKLAAKELSLRGFSGEKFRNSLINHSITSVKTLLTSS